MSTLQDSVTRMDTFLYELYEAAKYRHPNINAYFWGPGYKSYYERDTISSNLNRVFGCGFFSIVFLHSGSPEIQDEFDQSTHSLDCQTLLFVKSGDCNNNQCLWESNLLHANVTMVRYAHEALEMFSVERILEMKKFKYKDRSDLSFQLIAHVPDTANEWDFFPFDRWEEKTIKAMLIGKVDGGYYPIRFTINEAIKHHQTFITKLISPPPFVKPFQHFLKSRPIQLNWNSTRHSYQREILRSFSHSIRSTQICIFDGSIEEKSIRKFAQVMLSGCVIASNLVTEHDSFLKGNIIELGLYDPIEVINQKISNALQNQTELKRKASVCLSYARKHLTGLRELDLILDLSQKYRSGQRGCIFPYSFTSKCRRYHQSDTKDQFFNSIEIQFIPPWCRTDDRPNGFGKRIPGWDQFGEYHWNGMD
ncbi:hypothetical protein DFH28DRAFT_1088028 [Melampsora americana]|nr:hypothetical protein DFH28DRAFT_1088028 [Melampsora americana]